MTVDVCLRGETRREAFVVSLWAAALDLRTGYIFISRRGHSVASFLLQRTCVEYELGFKVRIKFYVKSNSKTLHLDCCIFVLAIPSSSTLAFHHCFVQAKHRFISSITVSVNTDVIAWLKLVVVLKTSSNDNQVFELDVVWAFV